MRRAFLILALAGLAAGCTQGRNAQMVIEQETKEAKDIAADALTAAPGLMSLGAWSRREDPRERRAVFMLVVPDAVDFCTILVAP